MLRADMGLGKTLQTIALILHMKQTLQSEDPILVIAPSSLLSNWRNELRKFAPALSVSAYYGNARDDLGGDEDKENGEPPAKKRRKSAVCTACAPVAISVFQLPKQTKRRNLTSMTNKCSRHRRKRTSF
jgi:SNF2 family DNA or RNA helicase